MTKNDLMATSTRSSPTSGCGSTWWTPILVGGRRLGTSRQAPSDHMLLMRHPRPGQDWMRWRHGQRFLHGFGEWWLARGENALVDWGRQRAGSELVVAD